MRFGCACTNGYRSSSKRQTTMVTPIALKYHLPSASTHTAAQPNSTNFQRFVTRYRFANQLPWVVTKLNERRKSDNSNYYDRYVRLLLPRSPCCRVRRCNNGGVVKSVNRKKTNRKRDIGMCDDETSVISCSASVYRPFLLHVCVHLAGWLALSRSWHCTRSSTPTSGGHLEVKTYCLPDN